MPRIFTIILAIGMLHPILAPSYAQERPPRAKLEKATLDSAVLTTRVIIQERVRVLMPKVNKR